MATQRRKRPPGRPQGGSDEIVRAVLRETLSQLGARGVQGLSVEEVARAAGVNKTSIYRRWPTKAELIVAAIKAAREKDPPPEDTGDLRVDLCRTLAAKAATLHSSRGRKLAAALAVVDDADAASVAEALRAHRFAPLRVVLDRAISRGDLPPDADPALLSETLQAAVVHRVLFVGAPADAAFLAQIVDLALAGARARPPPAPPAEPRPPPAADATNATDATSKPSKRAPAASRPPADARAKRAAASRPPAGARTKRSAEPPAPRGRRRP
ncbi:MAG TPA: TetR/AcrR family transcriptional regulator [Polyangiaceae bacterium]|nr:TetR/AcrR family transcriptional regulator [Polyangiaceae bacterium]